MKRQKSAIFILAAILLCGLVGCNDAKEKAQGERQVVFFHNVVDSGNLYLDGDKQPYGTVNFGNFGSLMSLEAGKWNVQVKDRDDDDLTDTDTILDTSFSVPDNDRINIYALSGRQEAGSSYPVKLHHLQAALKSGTTYDDNDIVIDLANIHPEYPKIAVFLLEDGQSTDTVTSGAADPVMVEYGHYSDDIKLSKSHQRIIVTDPDDYTKILFDSGEKTIDDKRSQILIFAENPTHNAKFRVTYFSGSTKEPQVWGDQNDNPKAHARVLNDIKDATFKALTANASDMLSGKQLAYGKVSDYASLPVGAYDFTATYVDGNSPDKPHISLIADRFYTVIFSGRKGDVSAARLDSDKRKLANKAQVSFINLAYKADEEDYKNYNVHLVKSSYSGDFEHRVPEASKISYKGTAEIEKRVPASNDGTQYTLRVMNVDNTLTIGRIDLTLKSGDIKQIALIENCTGGFELIDLDNPQGSCP